jgi:hypothetical protein
MLGGMWGARRGVLAGLPEMVSRGPRDDRYQTDQDFLEESIWPLVSRRCLQHDEYYGGDAFPTRRRGTSFVGQPFDEFDRPLITGPTWLARQLRQRARQIAVVAGLREAPFRFPQ